MLCYEKILLKMRELINHKILNLIRIETIKDDIKKYKNSGDKCNFFSYYGCNIFVDIFCKT